jgi:leader peptidase (prepilin peptidase) / N-methyltransferase
MNEDQLFTLFAFLFGLLIGSFLNVCIFRLPRDMSVVTPRSLCPQCEKTISWYDNIPILSFILLRGRCRECKAVIPWRYPVVELLTGIGFGVAVGAFGVSPLALKYCLLTAICITLIFSDLEERILPDEFTLGGTAIGLITAWFIPMPGGISSFFLRNTANPQLISLVEAVLGIVVCAGSLWLVGFLFEKVRDKEGLGFGDVKMIAMIGAFLGLQGALLTLIISSVAGSVIGLAFIAITGKSASTYELPFGTFLGAACLAVAVFGEPVLRFYSAMGV